MFGKVKTWLGIEGVKVSLLIPERIRESEKSIQGKIQFQTMHTQTVTDITITLIERYSRGRGANKLIDEYPLAQVTIQKDIVVPENDLIELDFDLPFTLIKSAIETFGSKNILFKGVSSLAHLTRNVSSVYRVEVQANVKGTGLSPFDKKEIIIK
jgi:hypothetical protein